MRCRECGRECQDCKREIANLAAHEAGWLMFKDGRVWCPEHVPEWLAAWWRKQQEWRGKREASQ